MNNVYLDYYKILWNFYVKFMSKFEVSMRNQILLGIQTWKSNLELYGTTQYIYPLCEHVYSTFSENIWNFFMKLIYM